MCAFRYPVESPFASSKDGGFRPWRSPRAAWMLNSVHGTIVCGVTRTPEARAAAQLAAALGARLELRVVLVHVVDRQTPDAAVQVTLEEVARALGGDVDVRVVHGNRVDELARVAADEGADAIVLGGRARGARGRQVRCTLARQLEAGQSVPVLIAPPATRERSGRRLGLVEASFMQ
jgi:nucleotide-binding universal stress UspA family protein